MSFLKNLTQIFNPSTQVNDEVQAQLDAANAKIEELEAKQPEEIEVEVPVEVPVLVETLTGVQVQFGSAKNEIDAQTYENEFATKKTVKSLVNAMFTGLNTDNIKSAVLTYADGRTESVGMDDVLTKEMPRIILVNTALGQGAEAEVAKA